MRTNTCSINYLRHSQLYGIREYRSLRQLPTGDALERGEENGICKPQCRCAKLQIGNDMARLHAIWFSFLMTQVRCYCCTRVGTMMA